MKNSKGTYWYRFTYEECPVCGHWGREYKERVYDQPKPEAAQDRHIYTQVYDYCQEDFYG